MWVLFLLLGFLNFTSWKISLMKQIPPYYRRRAILVARGGPLRQILNSKPFRFGFSQETLEALVEKRSITVWGPYGPQSALTAGDHSIVEYNQHIHESPHNLPDKLTYLPIYPYQPQGIYAIDKPSGCVVHPVQRYYHGTIQKQVERELGVLLNCVNRLDRPTSGVVIMANEHWTKRLKNEPWVKQKQYLALVEGEFPVKAECTDDIIYIYPTRYLVRRYGPAHTTFERIKCINGQSLILASLKTGFPHQIRIHLRNLGFPIVGDPLYGNNGKYCEIMKSIHQVTDSYLDLARQRGEVLDLQKRVPGSSPCPECFAPQYKIPPAVEIPLHAWKYSWRLPNEHFSVSTQLPNWALKFLASS